MPVTAVTHLQLAENLLDRLLDSELTKLDEAELRTLVHGIERLARKAVAASAEALVEISDRGFDTRWGHRNGRDLLIDELRLSPAEAARRMRITTAIVAMRTLTGDQRPPVHPDLAAGVRAGVISEAAADTVLSVYDKIPAAVDHDERASAAASLAEAATCFRPREIRMLGDRLLAHLDPDGQLTEPSDRARHRALTLSPQDAQMMSKLTATLDPATRAKLDVLLDTWAAPGKHNPDDPCPTDPDEAARTDLRSPAQRRHDAFSAMLTHIIATGALGSSKGSPAQVVITIPIDKLERMTGVVTTPSGGTIPVADAVELAGHNHAWLAVMDLQEQPLYLGRTKRLASHAQRIMLDIRDKGCTKPGCCLPSSWVQAHHDTDWSNGGATDINNLASACPSHHATIGAGPHQWSTTIMKSGPYRGRVGWIAPAHIDPTRTPRVNHLHHPDELLEQVRQRKRRGPSATDDPWRG
ncbi:HNH endonuclease signature motif containing protein [Williamsia sp. CHRR-6]|uniref:HNH endonuclease signature motif containing protein n=1 Tax=Williamsia sp. CHRR-6 TaxID=2835871 RepID=UPI001BDB03EF|nr:HNH endonuclease signature motif containing protein [Williamsia sp. CHRR-6]MBT0567804.1 DUF222 domain-containing protein [Williamsia sp. CHRR-6]